MNATVNLETRIEELLLKEQQLKLQQGLPHLHGLKMYQWQHDYFYDRNKQELMTAANQIGKSSIQIRKAIHWATEPSLWKELWPAKAQDPNFVPTFWYLYPNQDTVMQEVEEKWEVEFLPQGEYKDHPVYGWKKIIRNKVLKGIRFNSGVTIYFKTYSQNVSDLQAGTISAIFCDEELPEHIYPELSARLIATDGYFSIVFTATLGQDFWRTAIEPLENETEGFPDAFKRQISTFDCLEYHDGTETTWTHERIARVISKCKNNAEVQRRVYGKFVKDDGLKYFGFDAERNYVPFPAKNGIPFTGVPLGWDVYTGVDIGSGGEKNHPAAYTFVSASPDFTKLRVFKGKRLDGIETTTGDIYKYYKSTRGKLRPVLQSYDWASKDFGTITARAGDHFTKAQKSHDIGEDLLNTLFKMGILKIYQFDQSDKLRVELETLSQTTNKRHAKDDFIDSLRYAIATIPVDWEKVFALANKQVGNEIEYDHNDERTLRPHDYINEDEGHDLLLGGYDDEFEEYNELCGYS